MCSRITHASLTRTVIISSLAVSASARDLHGRQRAEPIREAARAAHRGMLGELVRERGDAVVRHPPQLVAPAAAATRRRHPTLRERLGHRGGAGRLQPGRHSRWPTHRQHRRRCLMLRRRFLRRRLLRRRRRLSRIHDVERARDAKLPLAARPHLNEPNHATAARQRAKPPATRVAFWNPSHRRV